MKEYTYRKHLKFIKYFMIVILLLFIVGFFFMVSIFGVVSTPSFMFVIVIIEGIFMQIFYNRFTSTALYLKEYGVGLKNNKKDIYIPFEEIKSINTKKVSNLGGFFTIISPANEKIRVTVALKDVADFVVTLKQKLIEYERPDLAMDPKLFAFYKTAAYSDDSFRRIRYLFPGFILVFLGMIISNFVLTLNDIVDANASFGISVFIAMAYMIYIEFAHYGKKVRNETDEITWEVPTFDQEKEKKHYQMISVIAVVAYVLLTILLNI